MVSYSSLDTTSYFNQSSDFCPPSAPTNDKPDTMSIQSRPGNHASAGDTQHLKDLFNNHIGLSVADLFQHATRHQPLDLSCHTSNHPSIIHDSSDQRSKSNRLAHPPLPIRMDLLLRVITKRT
ncbi:hypothetical protein H4Q26_017253 [Puccinia striiformis f. sp. tritici PST-130]|nr:hypothetical protein H4Q26_017253 [Puccinia striiformis f. sp. tritici PST-130]